MKNIIETDFNRNVYVFCGLLFDAIDMKKTVDVISAVCGNTCKRAPFFISTPNINFLAQSISNQSFRDSVLFSDLVVADGMPIVWLSKFLNIPIRERVAGASLFESLLSLNTLCKSFFFFGGPDGAAQKAHEKINESGTHVQSVGYISPGYVSLNELSQKSYLDFINSTNPDFLVVSLGAQKGQQWILNNLDSLDAKVVCHLGAVVNFIAGDISRAPQLMQKLGFEWLWRIYQEPKIYNRYLMDSFVLLKLIFFKILPLSFLLNKKKFSGVGFSFDVSLHQKKITYSLHGDMCADSLASFISHLNLDQFNLKDVHLDLSGLFYLDMRSLGLIVLLWGHQKKNNRKLVITCDNNKILEVIRLANVDYIFK